MTIEEKLLEGLLNDDEDAKKEMIEEGKPINMKKFFEILKVKTKLLQEQYQNKKD